MPIPGSWFRVPDRERRLFGRRRAFDLDLTEGVHVCREFGLAGRKFIQLQDARDDVGRVLQAERAWRIGGHRRVNAIEEIAQRLLIPITEELEPDERGSSLARRARV